MPPTPNNGLPTQADAQLAQHALAALNVALRTGSSTSRRRTRTVRFQPEGSRTAEAVELPEGAITLLQEILAQMANGNAVTIVPIHAEFTTNQAAAYLNVSRPFLVALLEEKKIAYRMVGTHRRIRFEDLDAFKQHDDRERAKIADTLAADAQADGLY